MKQMAVGYGKEILHQVHDEYLNGEHQADPEDFEFIGDKVVTVLVREDDGTLHGVEVIPEDYE